MILRRGNLVRRNIVSDGLDSLNIVFCGVDHLANDDDKFIFSLGAEVSHRIQVCELLNKMLSKLKSEIQLDVEPYYDFHKSIITQTPMSGDSLRAFFKTEKVFDNISNDSWKFIDFDKLYWSLDFTFLALGLHYSKLMQKQNSAASEASERFYDIRDDFHKGESTYDEFLKRARSLVSPLLEE